MLRAYEEIKPSYRKKYCQKLCKDLIYMLTELKRDLPFLVGVKSEEEFLARGIDDEISEMRTYLRMETREEKDG